MQGVKRTHAPRGGGELKGMVWESPCPSLSLSLSGIHIACISMHGPNELTKSLNERQSGFPQNFSLTQTHTHTHTDSV